MSKRIVKKPAGKISAEKKRAIKKAVKKVALKRDIKELKEAGWSELFEIYDLTGITKNQLEILRGAYDYGWYCAYGLESDDRRHKETMTMMEKLIKTYKKQTAEK